MKFNLRTRLIMDATIAVAGFVTLFILDWPIEAIGVVAVVWTITDCFSILLKTWGVKS